MDVKMSNNTIDVLVNFIKQQEGWSMSELRDDLIGEGKLMTSSTTNYEGELFAIDTDECSVLWGCLHDDDAQLVCNVGDLINDYGRRLLNAMCCMLESFKDQESFLYKKDED